MAGLDRSRDALFVERLHGNTLAAGLAWSAATRSGGCQAHVVAETWGGARRRATGMNRSIHTPIAELA